ncbi:MAG: aminotransferase class IV [Bacteroidia bacterium]|nr:aminotransferase class IV [Bacteroidia bacterium]
MQWLFNDAVWQISDNDWFNSRLIYGDGFFESMIYRDGKLLYYDLHLLRISKALKILQLETEMDVDVVLNKAIRGVPFKNGRLRVLFYRQSGGFYLPTTNNADIVVTAVESYQHTYKLNSGKLTMGYYSDNFKPMGLLSNIKTCNGLISVMAAKHAAENGFDDCFISNGLNYIETSNANLFLWLDGKLKTPDLNQGCVAGIMRQVCINYAIQQNVEVVESLLTLTDFELADDIILTNVGSIRSVKQSKLAFTDNFIAFLNK